MGFGDEQARCLSCSSSSTAFGLVPVLQYKYSTRIENFEKKRREPRETRNKQNYPRNGLRYVHCGDINTLSSLAYLQHHRNFCTTGRMNYESLPPEIMLH